MDKIKQLQKDLDDDQIDKFLFVYYDTAYYWPSQKKPWGLTEINPAN